MAGNFNARTPNLSIAHFEKWANSQPQTIEAEYTTGSSAEEDEAANDEPPVVLDWPDVDLKPRLDWAEAFLSHFGGRIDFRTLSEGRPKDRAIERQDRPGRTNYAAKISGARDGWPALLTTDNNRAEPTGVYFSINEMDGRGVEAANLKRIRCVAGDFDGGLPVSFPVPPSIMLETSAGNYQAFWLLQVDEVMTLDERARIMATLVANYKADAKAVDVARLLRVPGFWHRKGERCVDGRAFQVRIAQAGPCGWGADVRKRFYDGHTAAYSAAELVAAFPKPLAAPVQKTTPGKSLTTGGKYSEAWEPERIESALAFLSPTDDWLPVCGSLKNFAEDMGRVSDGWELFDKWSRADRAGYDERENRKRWNSFNRSSGSRQRIGTLYDLAKSNGWNSTRKSVGVKQVVVTDQATGIVSTIDWETKRGEPDTMSSHNFDAYIASIGVKPWLNTFDGQTYIRDKADRDILVNDSSLRNLRVPMAKAGCHMSVATFLEYLQFAASEQQRHPVRDYLDTLEWDGVARLDTWLHDYVGAVPSEYHSIVGSMWMIAAVRRVRQPGCKFDTMLVLEGKQYAGKSTVFSILASKAWFGDGVAVGADARELIEQTQGRWIIECAELSGMTGRDVTAVKHFCSKTTDAARAAYARMNAKVDRQFVLGATTNEAAYLLDKTGNRRFWGVAVGTIDLDGLRRDRDQLWAEAAYREAQDERIYLTPEQYALAAGEQEQREVTTPTEDRLREWFGDRTEGVVIKADVFKAIGFENSATITKSILYEVNGAMAKLGWVETQVRSLERKRGWRIGAGEPHLKYVAVKDAFVAGR
jgi:Virulence-associated protein E/RepB DNA-primase from phage plasmid/Primase C terminal 2 (PriCT-2)